MVEIAAILIFLWLVYIAIKSVFEDDDDPDFDRDLQDLINRIDNSILEVETKINYHSKKESTFEDDDDLIKGLKKEKSKVDLAHEYIASPAWNRKRRSVLARDEYTCQKCGAQNVKLDVHHKTYRNFTQEPEDDLITVCRECHEKLHSKYGYPTYEIEDEKDRYYYP